MPRGGARPGSGPAPDPSSARSKAKAARLAKVQAQGHTAASGKKKADAPAAWPFGTVDAAVAAPALAPVAPPKDDGAPVIPGGEPLDFLQAIINETRLTLPVRMQAAALAVSFKHAKPAPVGKKEGATQAAKQTASRFAAGQPPKLVAAGGKKV